MISVIVPVYNTIKYLNNCVASVLSQTYDDFELILIDDGSTDGSRELCDTLALNDKRIKVIHKKNGGLSSARNAGLDCAEGDYITFVDSDDYIHPQMLETLLYSIEKENADISMGFIENTDSMTATITGIDRDNYTIRNKEEYWHMGYEGKPFGAQFIMCPAKLYRKTVISDLRFREGMTHEDVVWASDYAPKIKRAIVFEDSVYYYYQRSGSIMHSLSANNIRDGLDSLLYNAEVCIYLFPKQANIGREFFFERFLVSTYNTTKLSDKDQSVIIDWTYKNRRKLRKLLSPSFTLGQRLFFRLVTLFSNNAFFAFYEYRFDIFRYMSVRLLKHRNSQSF